jgi:predicted metal-binding membrane protein
MRFSLPPGAAVAMDRGRLPSLATLLLLAVLAWAAVILWMQSSAMMDAMPGRAVLAGAALFAGMWSLMMAAMMLPAITPVVLLFRTIQRGRVTGGHPAVPAAAFVAGYLVVWAVAGILADLAYLAVLAAGDQLHAGSGAIPYIGGGILVLAGLYQLSPLKYVCLSHCRSPFHFMLHGWHEGRLGALRMGASHGFYCLGCCWGIMAVLFVVGLMNLAWMAVLSVLIVLEKLAPWGVAISRLTGVLFLVLGVFMAARPQLFPATGLQPAGAMPMAGMSVAASPVAGMSQAAPSMHTQHYAAAAGPYALTLTVLPGGRFTVGVADRAMGMPVAGAHVSLRFSGMGAPSNPVPALALRAPAGRYATTLRLMPGAYAVRIDVNGSLATMRVLLS